MEPLVAGLVPQDVASPSVSDDKLHPMHDSKIRAA